MGCRNGWPRFSYSRIGMYPPSASTGSTRRAGTRPGAKCLSLSSTTVSAPVTVLRDYHAENVMLVDGRGGIGRFGLLDFQDALAGHPAYDLVSVLEDARRDVPLELERDMIDRYRECTGADDRFERAYWALAAQRNTRILGVFCRLWKRDGKDRYKQFPAADVGAAGA